MQLKEIMTREVHGIRPDTPLFEAVEKLRHSNGEPLPVYEGERLVGMLTEHDIVEWTSRGGRDSRIAQVRDVMDRDVPFCFEDQDVAEAARLVRDRHARGVVVLRRDGNQGRRQEPVGTVSLADLAMRLQPTATTQPTGGIQRPERTELREEEVLVEEVIPETRVMLQPIAAPSILGLFGFAGATFLLGANWANWFDGNAAYLFPFMALLGGVAQIVAAWWSFRARDGLATAFHGTWGSFFLAYGLLQLLFATGTLARPSPVFTELGYWFIVLAAISFMAMCASLVQNIWITATLLTVTVGSALAAYAYISGNSNIIPYAGGCLVASAIIAWYTGGALLLENTFRRSILPLGRMSKSANVPGRKFIEPIEYEYGEPGVKMGQ